jgi:hypothetical protein
MNFLSQETVMNDIKRFAQSINDKYDADSCSVYIGQRGEVTWLGYQIEKDGKTYIVRMPYVQNEIGDLAIKTSEWTVSEDGKDIKIELPSLKEVFEAIDMQEVSN